MQDSGKPENAEGTQCGKESGELSDEELKMVNAAGNIYAAAGKTRDKDE